MSFELFQPVALKVDVPEHQLKSGTIATIVELIDQPPGCALEVFNALGQTVCVIFTDLENIESLTETDIPSIRRIAG